MRNEYVQGLGFMLSEMTMCWEVGPKKASFLEHSTHAHNMLALACGELAWLPQEVLKQANKKHPKRQQISTRRSLQFLWIWIQALQGCYRNRLDLSAVLKVTLHALSSLTSAGFPSSLDLSSTYHVASSSVTELKGLHDCQHSGQTNMRFYPPWLSFICLETAEYKLCFLWFWSQAALSLVIRVLSHVTVISLFSPPSWTPTLLSLFPWLEYQSSLVYITNRQICQDPRIKHLGKKPRKWCSHWIPTSFYNYFLTHHWIKYTRTHTRTKLISSGCYSLFSTSCF